MATRPPASPNLPQMLAQLLPRFAHVMDRLSPLVDQPVVRFPYVMPLANSASIAAGASNQVLPTSDFSHSLEWPFEVHKVRFSQDPSHTYRDWRITIMDQVFNQPMFKNSAMIGALVDENTGVWQLQFPWIIRPKGGGWQIAVDNLDEDNPITVDLSIEGCLLIPR